MSNYNLEFNIYFFQVGINSDTHKPIDKIALDFEYFVDRSKVKTLKRLEIKILSGKDFKLPEGLVANKQTQNSITYKQGNITFNDYYGKAIVEFDYSKEKAKIYYYDESFIHEITYLLILSRSGKFLDRKGYHKIHAACFGLGNNDIVLTLPSKGGKTTTLLEMLRVPKTRLISDDSPLVDSGGKLMPFPLRLGLSNKNKIFSYFPYLRGEDLYEFERSYFEKKYLIPINKLQNPVSLGIKQVLVNGKRTTNSKSILKKVSKYRMFKFLVEHMIIGLGLPMIIEYFLRNSIKDHFVNIKILFSRIKTAIFLLKKSDCYIYYMSNDPIESGKYLREFFSER